MLTERLRASGILVALAGSLDSESIARLASVPADLVAVRSAACSSGDRHGLLSLRRIKELLQLVESVGQGSAGEESPRPHVIAGELLQTGATWNG
jgi:hypothetical protein